jgi:hypothetical protein
VKTGNRSACATVQSAKCGNSDSAVLPVVPSGVYKVSINLIIQSKTPSNSHTTTLNRDNMFRCRILHEFLIESTDK